MLIDLMAGLGLLNCFHAAPEGVVQGMGRIAIAPAEAGRHYELLVSCQLDLSL